MTTTPRTYSALLASAATLCIVFASPAIALPQEIQAGNITYITGGIGEDERTALDAAKKDYNFTVMSANSKGELAGDTLIVIKDRAGNEALNVNAGPLFFANLPAGSYTVDSSNEGQFKTQKVTIREGKPSHLHLTWK